MGSSTGSTTAPGLARPLAGTGLTPRVAADRTDADLRIRKSASPLSTHIKSSPRADVAELHAHTWRYQRMASAQAAMVCQ